MNSLPELESIIRLLPYLTQQHSKKIVIKYGGAAMIDTELIVKVVEDIVLMSLLGFTIIIVHGGGPIINHWLNKVNIKPLFENGVRITDLETMEVVQMVLSGKVNKDLVSLFKKYPVKVVGISGQDGSLIIPKPIQILSNNRVAEIDSINTDLLDILLKNKYLPIIAPTALDQSGLSYNINADTVAGKIAGSLQVDSLIILTDTPGILKDYQDSSSIISHLTLSEVLHLVDNSTIKGGMLPKVNCCVQALHDGVKSTKIIDGRVPHSLLSSVLFNITVGSTIMK